MSDEKIPDSFNFPPMFWLLHRRVAYRLNEWDSPEFAHHDRKDYEDSYVTELERACKVFKKHPEFFDKLPDAGEDPIIGLRKIDGICQQAIKKDNEKVDKPLSISEEKAQLAKDAKDSSEAFRKKHPKPNGWPPFPLSDLDSDDPRLISEALAAIQRIIRNYIPDVGCWRGYLERAVGYALDIRSAWLIGYELDIPEIPMADNPQWPEKQDFIKLEQWFTTLAGSVHKHIREVEGQLMSSPNDNNESYQDFLANIAGEVDEIIQDLSKKRRLKQQVEAFIEQYDLWHKAVTEGQEAAKKDGKLFIGKKPCFAWDKENDKQTEPEWEEEQEDLWWREVDKNCPEGYVRHDPNDFGWCNELTEIGGYYYGLPLPLNPVDTLCPRDFFNQLLPNENTAIIERKPKDEAENILRRCILLVVIHANKSTSPPLVDTELDAVSDICNFWCGTNHRTISCHGTSMATEIRSAVNAVKHYLDSKQEAIEEKPKLEMRGESMEYDLFISHASEDKKDFVEPLANALKEAGIKVWYDRFELKLGDSLRGKIDEGLANSRYGVVVLSHFFFNKDWPKTELDALVSKENGQGKKVILPIWHEITRDEVSSYSPILASKLAAQSSDTIESIVEQINKVLNEDSILEDSQQSVPKKEDDRLIKIQVGNGKPVQVTAIGNAPEAILEKAIESGYKNHFPSKPFQAGYICKLVSEESYTNIISKLGACVISEEETNLILTACGGKYSIAKLRLYLAQTCNISSPDNMTIKEIVTVLKEKSRITKDLNCEMVETEKTKMQCIKEWAENNPVIVILLIIIIATGVLAKFKEDISTLIGLDSQRINKEHSSTSSIFAEVSKDGEILRAKEFPWKIEKRKNEEGDILYTIIDRRGDATAVTVIPDTPKYTVYQSYDGMVIKYTCPEGKISDFKIMLKY